ncbi:MAG: HAD family phosphatase [Acidobacteriota bacterium]
MNRRAVIFDLDGVLIDSMPFHYQAWRQAFREFDITITREEIYEREGEKRETTAKELYTKHAGKEPAPNLIESIIHSKDKVYSSIFRVQFMHGALELLSLVESNKGKLGLVTGATSLDDLFREHKGFLAMFDAIVDGDEPEKGKPAPDPYLLALRKLGLLPQNCYVVENAPLGIRSAVAAHLTCLAVKGTSPLSHKILKEAGARSVYENIEQLRDDLFSFLASDN